LLLAVLALCAACSGTQDDPPKRAHADVKICVYTDGDASRSWQSLENGAERAGADLGVTLDYQEAEHDLEAEANLVVDGVRSGCDGIAFSASDPSALRAAADQAHAAGVPLVTLNAGVSAYQQLHAFTHVGMDDTGAGSEAAARLRGLGATRLLCVGQDGEDPALDQVCAGAKTGAGTVETMRVTTGLADLPASAAEVERRLRADPSIDGVLVLDPDLAAGAVLPAVRAAGSTASVGTVGVSPRALEAVRDGSLAFAMDEQPFVQGYLPVVLLYLQAIGGGEAGGGLPVYSGPEFVTQDDASRVLELERAGTR
jgi:simple sugar transport system substrate-binding protein